MSGAFAGELAVVVGYGISGRAAAGALAAEGAEVRVTEERSADAVAAEAPEWPDEVDPAGLHDDVELLTGGHRPEHLDGATLVVVSPGVPEGAPVIAWARSRGLPVWSELELGARLCRVPYIAVTGTNGKTTTVELLAAMMRASGLAARACGNVGHPFSLAARDASLDALVVEASSFQLAFQESLRPEVSILLNVAPDHLDWHGTTARYAAAKARVFVNQRDPDVHVGNRDDAEAARISRSAPCAVRWFGSGSPEFGGGGIVDGRVVLRPADAGAGPAGRGEVERGDLVVLESSPESTRAFKLDVAAAGVAADAFGLRGGDIRLAVDGFASLPHRGSVVAEVGSVRFVDDSKATNPHAVLAALEGATDVVLIAGGVAKGVDLSPLASAAGHLAAVVAIGEAARAIVEVFKGLVPVQVAGSMEEAVATAYERAPERGTVLLAPACASQDMFRDYRERGDRFAAAARILGGGVGSAGRSEQPARPAPSRRTHA